MPDRVLQPLLAEPQVGGGPVDLVGLGIESQRNLDLPPRFVVTAALRENARLDGMGCGQPMAATSGATRALSLRA